VAGLPEGLVDFVVVIFVVQWAGDGPNCVVFPRLVSGSRSSSIMAAVDQESFGVLLGGELRPRLDLLGGGVWMSVSCPFLCSLAGMLIPGSEVAFLLQRAFKRSQEVSRPVSQVTRPR
jgi:hypothetical protein